MRILQVAPLWEAVPPPAYGGTEAVVSVLTEELVRRGHDVILAASGDSSTAARLSSVYPRSLRTATHLTDRAPYDWAHIGNALALAREVDIVHNHAGELMMAMADAIDAPMLTTMHCLPTQDTRIVWERYTGAYNTISRAQAAVIADIKVPGTFVGPIYNSIDVQSFPFSPAGGEDLLFLSRIAPEKGPHLAVEVARRTGRRLILAGKVDRYDERFFEEVVRDLIDGDQIVFVGEADAQKKRELYASARCLLLPLQWEEPFGLVMAEAMACGTPVIALRRGSAPELIAHGETGFVVDTVDEMVSAVGCVGALRREACRDWVAHRFTPQIMASKYIQVYEQIIEERRAPRVFVVSPTRAQPATPGVTGAGASEVS